MRNLNKLSRTEMKNVLGGVAEGGGTTACWITYSGPNHSNPQTGMQLVDGTGAAASSNANAYCVALIATAGNGVNHCSYNCSGA